MGYNVEWAGYGPDGNDRRGHLHPDPNGTFIRSDGLKGFYCNAPLNSDLTCDDPPPAFFDTAIDWVMAVRKFGIDEANRMFP